MGKFIGMSGIYAEASDPESAWLGWFGVLPEYRRERFATRMLNVFAEECRALGFKYARIYTTENNIPARECYKFNGFSEEIYGGVIPFYVIGGPVYIYSRSLYPNYDCPPWNDRHLDF
jgi:ribosomal protein S18 acetylase RimI-like enzyme